jgi:hypothetical protein
VDSVTDMAVMLVRTLTHITSYHDYSGKPLTSPWSLFRSHGELHYTLRPQLPQHNPNFSNLLDTELKAPLDSNDENQTSSKLSLTPILTSRPYGFPKQSTNDAHHLLLVITDEPHAVFEHTSLPGTISDFPITRPGCNSQTHKQNATKS